MYKAENENKFYIIKQVNLNLFKRIPDRNETERSISEFIQLHRF